MTRQTFKSAKRRYLSLLWPLMTLYVIIILAGSYTLSQFDAEPRWLQISLALASAAPVIATLFAMLRYANETDEYTRLVQLKAFAWGGAFTISAVFLVGFFQIFDVIASFEVFWLGPIFFLAYGLATMTLNRNVCE